ncbi:MAG: hypothetical protein KKD77_22060, partial [Gammaproteobacteria bacterium]|nr:hypothetical protein [Gammaproteobacteria bacterium]
MKTIGIIGTRCRDTLKDLKLVRDKFCELYESGDCICSGLCPKGGDRFAVILASHYKTSTLWFPADWERYGKGAGFVRNTDIARESDILVACVAPARS